MQAIYFVLAALVATATASNLYVLSEQQLEAYEEVRTVFQHIRDHGRLTPAKNAKKSSPNNVGTFQFTNCADPDTEIMVPRNLKLSPDPVEIPGNITASGGVLIKSKFGSPMPVGLKIWKQLLGVWIEIPCIDEFGSCNYNDFCDNLKSLTCPPEFKAIGLSCKCPFTEGNFNVPPINIEIAQPLPVKITGGVRARLAGTFNDKTVTCIEVQFDLA